MSNQSKNGDCQIELPPPPQNPPKVPIQAPPPAFVRLWRTTAGEISRYATSKSDLRYSVGNHHVPLQILPYPRSNITPRRQGKRLAGHALVELNVPAREHYTHIVRNFGPGALVFVLESLAADPEPEEFLVQALRFLPTLKALFVCLRHPVAGGIRGMNLICEGDGAVLVHPHLVFRVDQNEPMLAGDFLPPAEDREGFLRDFVPLFLCREPLCHDSLGINVFVILRFCGGREDDIFEWLILHHTLRKLVPAEIPHAAAVIHPRGGFGGTGEIRPHHDLHLNNSEIFHHRDIGIRKIEDMRRHDVIHLIKPPRSHLAQNLPLEGNGAPVDVKGGLAVRGNEDGAFLLRLPVHITHLALVALTERGEICLLKGGGKERPECLWSDHGEMVAERFVYIVCGIWNIGKDESFQNPNGAEELPHIRHTTFDIRARTPSSTPPPLPPAL